MYKLQPVGIYPGQANNNDKSGESVVLEAAPDFVLQIGLDPKSHIVDVQKVTKNNVPIVNQTNDCSRHYKVIFLAFNFN